MPNRNRRTDRVEIDLHRLMARVRPQILNPRRRIGDFKTVAHPLVAQRLCRRIGRQIRNGDFQIVSPIRHRRGIPGIKTLRQLVLQQVPGIFRFAPVVHREDQIVIVVVMRAPQYAGISLFAEALRRRTRRARMRRRIRGHSKIREIRHAGPLRHAQLHRRRRCRSAWNRRKSLHPDVRILHHDFVQHRRHIVRLVSDIDPRNTRRMFRRSGAGLACIRKHHFPLQESCRRARYRLTRTILVGPRPRAPIFLRARRVS